MAQPLSDSGGGLGFDLDLYSAAPEWFGCAEDDVECDCSHGRDCLPWYYAMEGGL